eukprot:SM001707S03100  [mRNA]  locus=s1707:883:1723:- [translate_table: standard]
MIVFLDAELWQSLVYAALAGALLEAAKLDLHPAELQTALAIDYGVRSQPLAAVYGDNRGALRRLLQELTKEDSPLPQLTGASCELEPRLSDAGVKEEMYCVTLRLRRGPGAASTAAAAEEDLTLACSEAQLQDLLAAVHDACQSLERAVSKSENFESDNS